MTLAEDPFSFGKKAQPKGNLKAQTSVGFATKSGGSTKLPKLPEPRSNVPEAGLPWGYCSKATPRPPPGTRPRSERGQTPTHAISPTKKEIQSSFNAIDESVGEMLENTVQELVASCEKIHPKDATGMYVIVERCHNCAEDHALTTRHNEFQYANLAHDLLHYMKDTARDTIMDVDEILCPLHTTPRCLCTSYSLGREIWHNASRVGAFEVYLLTPPPPPDLLGGRIKWPKKAGRR